MTHIIGFAGKKQSGKNTCANAIVAHEMVAWSIVDHAGVDNNGNLCVTADNEQGSGILNIQDKRREVIEYLDKEVFPYVKVYAFADPLKQLCINLFGLTEKQCYGTDDEKNTLTQISWESIPGLSTNKTGFMSAREVLQIIGTNIFRKINPNIWVQTTINQILKEKPRIAIIADVRFPNEIMAIRNAGGKVIHLTRSVTNDDTHDSECALDDLNFVKDAVLVNEKMSVSDQCQHIINILEKWDYFLPTK